MMEQSLLASTVSHFGVDRSSPPEARRKASMLFSRALSKGQRRSLWCKFTGQENRLRDLARFEAKARRQPARYAGIVLVPLANIVGSAGRTHDFDNAFHPLNEHLRNRWVGIAAARRRGVVLPPVDLIQVGNAYYVHDGHHRVSVAKALGQMDIEANILYRLVG